MSQKFNYCLLCQNIISMPVLEKIEHPKYDIKDGIVLGFINHLAAKETHNSMKSYTHEIYSKNAKIGETIVIVTRDFGKGEIFHSTKNLYTILNELGMDGWEVVSTNIDYYGNDQRDYDIEKRYILKNILQVNDDYEHMFGETLLTRTKYLMKRSVDKM